MNHVTEQRTIAMLEFVDWLRKQPGRTFRASSSGCCLAQFFNEYCNCGDKRHGYYVGLITALGICYELSEKERALERLVTAELSRNYTSLETLAGIEKHYAR